MSRPSIKPIDLILIWILGTDHSVYASDRGDPITLIIIVIKVNAKNYIVYN